MKVLVLWADNVSANLGVRALADGTARLVRRVDPSAEVTFHNFGTARKELPVGRFRSVLKERVLGTRGMQRWLGGFDLVVDTRSGDSFADVYGLRRFVMMSAVAECAVQAGTPVVLGPQTIGPFATKRAQWIARRSLNRATLVLARDSNSARRAMSLGRPVDATTTDVVFTLPVPRRTNQRDVILNVSGLLWASNPHTDASTYRQTVLRLAQRLISTGREVSLLAHVLDSASADNDVPAVQELANSLPTNVETIVPTSLEGARTTLASANLVIGSRMHACLNALSVGTPAIPLAYSNKFAPLLDDLGWPAIVDLRHDPDPVARTLLACSDPTLTGSVAGLLQRTEGALKTGERALNSVLQQVSTSSPTRSA